jgi:DNA-directed RNA polymerase specialized sigma24 family protein
MCQAGKKSEFTRIAAQSSMVHAAEFIWKLSLMSLDHDPVDSVIGCINDFKQGDAAAAFMLSQRYFERLVRLASQLLRGKCRPAGGNGSDDIANSALHSFLDGVTRDQFRRLRDRNDVWWWLFLITKRKVTDEIERQRRLKNGGGRVVGEVDLAANDDDVPDGCVLDREGAIYLPARRRADEEPTAEEAVLFAETLERQICALGDESLIQVARLSMDGYTHEEIAAWLGCSLRTVYRKLDSIRRILTEQP